MRDKDPSRKRPVTAASNEPATSPDGKLDIAEAEKFADAFMANFDEHLEAFIEQGAALRSGDYTSLEGMDDTFRNFTLMSHGLPADPEFTENFLRNQRKAERAVGLDWEAAALKAAEGTDKAEFLKYKFGHERMMRDMAQKQRGEQHREDLFAPADIARSVDYGDEIAHRSSDLMFDPTEAMRFWTEIGTAWLRVMNPVMASVLTGERPGTTQPIDIFVSHAREDEAEVRAFREDITALPGLVTFVDWIDEPKKDRINVNADTADWLRQKMRESKALVLLLSENSAASFWVQWELGYFDALRGRVVLMPLSDKAKGAIEQQEYYGLYDMAETIEDLRVLLEK